MLGIRPQGRPESRHDYALDARTRLSSPTSISCEQHQKPSLQAFWPQRFTRDSCRPSIRLFTGLPNSSATCPFARRSLPTSPEGTITPTFEFGAATRAEDADAMIEQLLGLPAQVASKRKRRVALVIDEFQSILELDESLPRKMRAVFQFQPDVAHVYLGSKQHLLHRVFTDANAPLYSDWRRGVRSTPPPRISAV
jgi:hypothetical protein